MATKIYRLGEYKIIDFGTGEVRWEAHSGFAGLQEGRCFRKGTILFIGPAENDQIGFLKGDFLDNIKAFPLWSKTPYYCRAFDVSYCKSGKRVAKQEMLLWTLGRGRDEAHRPLPEGPTQRSNPTMAWKAVTNETFRLEPYEIARETTGQIVWKTASGPNTISQGTCTVLENILFIGPGGNTEFYLTGRQFAEQLQQLPKWDQTEYYCPKSSLCDCTSWNRVKEATKTRPRAKTVTGKHDAAGKIGKRIRFKPVRTDIWKRQALIFSHRAKESVIDAAEALRLIIALSSSCSIRFCKELKRNWDLKKGKRPSFYNPDD